MSKAQQNSPSADPPEAEDPPEPRGGGDVSGKGARPSDSTSPSDRDYGGIAIDPPDNTGGGSNW
jgi:hypothetical protein